jgi:FkbM family methyltransferase
MTTTKDRLHQRAVRLVAANRDRVLPRALRRIARSYLDLDGNRSFAPLLNGEARVLEVLGAAGARVIFDVGANVGDWSRLALQLIPDAQVHAFEIVPATAEELARNFADSEQARVNGIGLGEAPGTVEIRFYPSFSEASGVTELPVDIPFELLRCPVTTGELYCAERGVERIDLLKIDVEGFEDRVLKGFEPMLQAGRVEVVQFEYGIPNITSHVLLADFSALFDELGYTVGKIYPLHVDFRAYDRTTDEDFRGPNFLAVKRTRGDLIARLAERS